MIAHMENLMSGMEVFVDVESLKWIVGFIVTMLIFAFSIIKILDSKAEKRQDRMEERHRQEMSSIRQDVASHKHQSGEDLKQLHQALSDVRERYVKRETHDQDIERINRSFSDLRTEVRQDISSGIQTFNEGLNGMRKDFTEFLLKIVHKDE